MRWSNFDLPVSIDWINEKIAKDKDVGILYKIISFFMFKRKDGLTYKDVFMISYAMNKKKGHKEAMLKALSVITALHSKK